jgi:hypothetical protein
MTKSSVAKNQQEIKPERPTSLMEMERLIRAGVDFHVALTAKLAGEILIAWNTGNRRIDEVRAQAMKRDMAAERWLAGEAIGFGPTDDDGIELGDGQHRLHAQVASNTEQVYHVRVFSDATEFAVFIATRDSGKVRTLADLIGILRLADGSGAAMAFERVCNAWQSFLGNKPARLTRQERLDFAYKHVGEIGYVLTLPTRQFRAHTLAAIAIASTKYRKPVAEFISQVISGADLPAGSPALELSKALPALNEAAGIKEKERAMANVMRVIHDGIRGRKRTTVHAIARTKDSPIIEAIVEFAGKSAATGWTERHAPKLVEAK